MARVDCKTGAKAGGRANLLASNVGIQLDAVQSAGGRLNSGRQPDRQWQLLFESSKTFA